MLREIDEATARLFDSLERLTDEDMRQPTLLPGWTRGHLITHLARGCGALTNLIHGLPPYVSQEVRNADIEAGAGRGAAELLADLTAANAVLRDAMAAAFDEESAGRWTAGDAFTADQAPVRRLSEVELHHVDLAVGYTANDWPAYYAGLELFEPLATWRQERLVGGGSAG
ncbi:maleylpyruvate isomerase N-terminal domain-containing protein [Winogradskya humida]|uniref:Mycothiol-dependent maleylpyruvate isomerase metal-binding domain-containing protein n=1 Tax=Winogradskya humida TaxID=113566 RepID=A0ABQ3ZQI0_9ACTN|nr:maleylpyruvate isomerase family mycothiol-dependent enzyme [Actinoplanes humidus]GIE20829.1 hypothetical protein Ahu01nite_039310 [Actinoplanes humidus]